MVDTPIPTRFGLMRHAPTKWNSQKRIQGIADSSLTEAGEQLARTWGRHLVGFGWNRILASHIGRARHTAELINTALQIPMDTTADLREMDWGEWTGRTIKDVSASIGETMPQMEAMGWNFQPPGGEARHAVLERGRRALLKAAGSWPGQAILVITHEGVIKALLYRLLGRQYLPSEPAVLKSGHLHWLTGQEGRLSLVSLNAVDLSCSAP